MSLAYIGIYILILGYAAHLDYWNLRIPNRWLSALLVLWIGQEYWLADALWFQDLISGAVLFVVGLLFWRLRKITPSEVKLLLIVGLHLGVLGSIIFASSLPIILTLQRLALLTWAKNSTGTHPFWRRLRALNKKRRIPAGPAIILAAILGLVARQILV